MGIIKDICINMPQEVLHILKKLNQAGYEAYIVGGCVRDSVIGRIPHDWDVCTSAMPEDIIKVFNNHKIIPTGIKHGTVTVVLDKGQYEITTFRIDGEYENNRHPKNVKFTKCLKEDLKRRDFTINALAYNPDEGLIDYFGGLRDIKRRVIRCVGNADKRFHEDALRVLRAIRFSSNLDFKIYYKTFFGILSNKKLLKNISVERINSETIKILQSKNLKTINAALLFSCLLNILYELNYINNKWEIIKFVSSDLFLEMNNSENIYLIRLSMLFESLNTNQIYKLLRKLRFDNNTINSVVKIVKYGNVIMSEVNKNDKYLIRKSISDIGYYLTNKTIEYAYIHNRQIYVHLFSVFKSEYKKCNSIRQMKLNGDDLIKIGFNGKEIGNCLNYLLDNILTDRIENDYEILYNEAIRYKERKCYV